ncbi:MAG TPA: hypothetical protein VNL16_00090 [Chloroflexota bacterium]|nr:hypothetical protein [Chloroflexota bacterium]
MANLQRGRTGPFWTPAAKLLAQRDNDERLRSARRGRSFLRLRIAPQLRTAPGVRQPYCGLRAQAFPVEVPEVVDVWDFLRDLRRFAAAWRPMRERTPEAQMDCRRLLDEWERRGDQVRR